jgi:hypothetical protein
LVCVTLCDVAQAAGDPGFSFWIAVWVSGFWIWTSKVTLQAPCALRRHGQIREICYCVILF